VGAAPTERGESAAEALRRLVDGYQVSQAIHVAAALGIADLLADGPRTADDLATLSDSHPASLYRLLRALASVGVLHEDDERRFALTDLGQCLRSDAPEPVGGWAEYIGRPYRWESWAHLIHSVRTGENAFRHAHGVDVWEYWSRAPEEGAIFDRAMTHGSLATNRALLDAYDFGRFGTVVDVGGGQGAFLAALLAEHATMQGVLFDQPQVVETAGELLGAAGVADRCEVVAGSFFEAVPAGGDAYVLQGILHDWADDDAVAILRVCRQAVARDAALLVLERELGAPNENRDAKFADLNMLVGPGGRERTLTEYGELFAASGFQLRGMSPSRSGIDIIEATAT
jgi:O-methyltransferase domain/Dimerisation domain